MTVFESYVDKCLHLTCSSGYELSERRGQLEQQSVSFSHLSAEGGRWGGLKYMISVVWTKQYRCLIAASMLVIELTTCRNALCFLSCSEIQHHQTVSLHSSSIQALLRE